MRTPVVAIATLLAAAQPAHSEDRIPLPPVTVIQPQPKIVPPPAGSAAAPNGTGAARGSAGSERCVDIPAGSDKSFACLNQSLRRKVDEVNPTTNTPPIDARSSDLKTGVVNIPGVQQQYGTNFGHSVVPYRPPPLTYSSPLGGRH